jgi:hypothetical protein
MLRDAKSLKREALKLTAEHTDDADATDEKAISVANRSPEDCRGSRVGCFASDSYVNVIT